VEFLAITFAITWSLHGALAATGVRFSLESPTTAMLYLPGLLAPSGAAFIVEARRSGRSRVGDLLRLADPRRARRSLLIAAAAVQPFLTTVAFAVSGASSRVAFDPAMAVGQLWVVAGEEFGWRGWLWPRAVNRFGALWGTVLVTAVWGLWHLPMFAVVGSSQAEDGVVVFAAAIAAWSTIHGLLQVHGRSVATAMLFHAMTNITVSTIEVRNRSALLVVYAVAAASALWWLGCRSGPRSPFRFLGGSDREGT
jgi:membrane protease YdiL (CAAX protease family)